jgi:hypothetical protein
MSPRWGSTPRQTDWLTVSRNGTFTLTLTLGSQLRSIGEALYLLKRVELMEESDSFHRNANNAPAPDTNNNYNNRQGLPRNHYDRNGFQGQVRHIQRHNPPDRNQHYQPRRNRYDSRRTDASDNEESRSPRHRNVPERAQREDSPRSRRRVHDSES